MTDAQSHPNTSMLERARDAAVDALGTYDASPPSFKLAMRSVAETGANAALRIALTEIGDELISNNWGFISPATAQQIREHIDALTKELG